MSQGRVTLPYPRQSHVQIQYRRVVVHSLVLFFATNCEAAESAFRVPTGAPLPTSYADCAALSSRWSQLASSITNQHKECLSRSHENETQIGSCSKADCQSLHDAMTDLLSGTLAQRR